MTRWTAESLRRAALAALGPFADERARDALRRGALVIEPEVAQWESSRGRMRAHRVHLWLDAPRLGALRAAPPVEDALRTSLAQAIAEDPEETLHELALAWAPAVVETPYRDAPRAGLTDGTDLGRALAEYLRASGHAEVAALTGRASVHATRVGSRPLDVRLELPEVDGDALRRDPRALEAVTRALRDLVGDPRARVLLCSP